MIVQCQRCKMWFEGCYRSTLCPHRAFPANDGSNNFEVHENSWLDVNPPGDVPLGNHSWEDKE